MKYAVPIAYFISDDDEVKPEVLITEAISEEEAIKSTKAFLITREQSVQEDDEYICSVWASDTKILGVIGKPLLLIG